MVYVGENPGTISSAKRLDVPLPSPPLKAGIYITGFTITHC